ncbi:DUF1543 domain-containing protein [uncultured Cytophaga sp.]|uniref:DUF1543 domain-containing protein n=1 Tax=uncultured Cytophaga sp. TaxID=160238 RepID=UPI002618F17C|nr:DUF1543 domain-containing protein [uncultured Cytophaga sp.]
MKKPVQPKLFMLLLGCKPEGRNVEQHDVFFGIGTSLKGLVPAIKAFWPEGKKGIHIDAWREVTRVQNYVIRPRLKTDVLEKQGALKLFFINLGGYRRGEFEELHYKILVVAKDSAGAVRLAKKEKFYKQTGFKEAPSHIDEKYGIDVDDIYNVKEILPEVFSAKYVLEIIKEESEEDIIELGYLPVSKIK